LIVLIIIIKIKKKNKIKSIIQIFYKMVKKIIYMDLIINKKEDNNTHKNIFITLLNWFIWFLTNHVIKNNNNDYKNRWRQEYIFDNFFVLDDI